MIPLRLAFWNSRQNLLEEGSWLNRRSLLARLAGEGGGYRDGDGSGCCFGMGMCDNGRLRGLLTTASRSSAK